MRKTRLALALTLAACSAGVGQGSTSGRPGALDAPAEGPVALVDPVAQSVDPVAQSVDLAPDNAAPGDDESFCDLPPMDACYLHVVCADKTSEDLYVKLTVAGQCPLGAPELITKKTECRTFCGGTANVTTCNMVVVAATVPTAANVAIYEQWIADLGSPMFKVREAAQSQLAMLCADKKLRDAIWPMLECALEEGASPEARKRIQALLDGACAEPDEFSK
jgi:hypothetical protein